MIFSKYNVYLCIKHINHFCIYSASLWMQNMDILWVLEHSLKLLDRTVLKVSDESMFNCESCFVSDRISLLFNGGNTCPYYALDIMLGPLIFRKLTLEACVVVYGLSHCLPLWHLICGSCLSRSTSDPTPC